MASKLKDTAATVRSVARTFQAVIDMADALDAAGDLDQAGLDAQKRLDAVNADISKANNWLGDLNAKINAAQKELENVNDDVLGARAKADKEAADIMVKMKADADALLTKSSAKVTAMEKKADEAQECLDDINVDITGKQAELRTLNDNITRTKAQLRALVN